MRRTRITTITALAAAGLTLAACGGGGTVEDPGVAPAEEGGEPAAGGDGDQPYVALVSKGFQHQFWQAVQQGAEDAAEEFDVELSFEGPDDESQVDQQIQMLNTALERNPDALGFAALDSQAAEPLLEQADEAGVPVIAFDSGVESDIPVTTVSTDNSAAAAGAAEHMAELIGGEGQVALVVHDQTSISGIERRDGFVEWMEENAPDIEIVDIQYGGGDQLESTSIARSMITANPELDGMFGSNEGSAIGIVNAVQELDAADQLTVVGFDSGQAQIEAIRNGTMEGAITQNPIGIGYETVKAAVDVLEGEEVPESIDTGYYWYDQSNIDDEEIQAVIYE